VLACDDEKDIRTALRIYLSGADYQVLEAENGRQALEILAIHDVDLVLMDIMMPVMDGLTALSEIRQRSAIPVILLTAKGEDSDKIIGLNLGADDYVTKPFNAMEVLARVRAVLRRFARQEEPGPGPSVLRQGGVELDDEAKRVTVEGEEISVTPKEYDILKLLLENPGKVFSSQEIYQRVWKNIPLGPEGTVAVHIRHLREKLEINPAEPRYIKVVWGKGYKLEKQT
jgi:DNA-binding response OmpR family regulator